MKKNVQLILVIAALGLLLVVPVRALGNLQEDGQGAGLAPARVSEDGKYLVGADGEPFLWMGDTAWDLTHRLTREEIVTYLDDRQEKGFSVIMMRLPFKDLEDEVQHDNRYGQVPFENQDITQPNEDYFELIDFVLEELEKRDMVAGILPLWGFVVGGKQGFSVDEDDIVAYANWLSHRYVDRKNIIWISGGDTGKNNKWALLGSELKKADPGKLVTFHPGRKGLSSYHLFGDAEWLDFHMIQTGHSPDLETNYVTTEEIYRDSSKPVLNGEPAYEDIAVQNEERISAHQVRKAAYWSLLAGGFGHNYGHAEIFQFARAMEGQPDTWGANNSWTESLDEPGVRQMGMLINLLQTVPWHRFQPMQSLVFSENPHGPGHIRAAVADDKSQAWVYFPEKQEATIDLAQLRGNYGLRWFDPASGEIQEVGNIAAVGSKMFEPPFNQDALLMFGAPFEEEAPEDNGMRFVIVGVGVLLILVLLMLVLRQVRTGIG
jgi:hypothetical protein